MILAAALLAWGAAAQPGRNGGNPPTGNNPFGGMSQEQMQEMFRRMNQPPTGDDFEMKEIHVQSAGNDIYG